VQGGKSYLQDKRKFPKSKIPKQEITDQFVHELLARVLEDIESDSVASEALLAEGYQLMAKENAETVEEVLAAQLMAVCTK